MPPIKMIFKDEFPLERITLKGDIKAPPMTKHYSLVGTAFDYLLRFYLEKENPNCVTEPWVAESAVPLLNAADKLKNDVAVSTEDLKYIQTAVMLEQSIPANKISGDCKIFFPRAGLCSFQMV